MGGRDSTLSGGYQAQPAITATSTEVKNEKPKLNRKPIYSLDDLNALLQKTGEMSKLSLSLLSMIVSYAEEKPILLPEIKETVECGEWDPTIDHDAAVKIFVVGDERTGKSSLIRCFLGQERSGLRPCAAPRLVLVRMTVKIGKLYVKAQITESSGEKVFLPNPRASGVVVVFDVGDKSTFNDIERWLPDRHVPVLLCGNHQWQKGKQRQREVTAKQAEAVALKQDFDYIETDTENPASVRQAFVSVIYRLIQQTPLPYDDDDSEKRLRRGSALDDTLKLYVGKNEDLGAASMKFKKASKRSLFSRMFGANL